MDTVRIGIVGIDNMGSAHATNILAGNIKGLVLGAVCDIDPEKRRWATEKLPGVPVCESYTDMLDNAGLDAVLVAVPHYLHPEVCAAGFERGLHVLSEKPAGVFTNQVEAMYRAAEKAGTVFDIMFNQRTNPLFQKARELVQNGWLGEPKRFVWIITNWYRLQAYYNSGGWRATWDGEGGGVLLNQARTTWICGNDLWRAAAHSGILQNFTNAILYGEELLAPGFDGIRSLNISNAAYLSDWTGEPVSLPVDGDRFEELLGERVLASQKPEKGETDHFTPGAYSPRWQVRW